MRQWIMVVFAASLLSAMALALCPEGRVKPVVRMVCGVICALAIASPLLRIDADSIAAALAAYSQQAGVITEEGESEEIMLKRTYIEEECAAYICVKAEEAGTELFGASVQARWDDDALIWVPWSVTLDGAYDKELSVLIERDLGVPAARQEWSEHG